MKTCTSCENTLPLDSFAARKATRKDGKAPWCKDCVRAYQRKLRAKKRTQEEERYAYGLQAKVFELTMKAGLGSSTASKIAPVVTEGLLTTVV